MNNTNLKSSLLTGKEYSDKIKSLITVGKIRKAEQMACKRHEDLINSLSSDNLSKDSKLNLVEKLSKLVKEEHRIAAKVKSKENSRFILKRSAFKAYLQKAA